ncbi:MAG: hypothetical protein WC916_06650 [Candidatus Woesearchaeota archaeon]
MIDRKNLIIILVLAIVYTGFLFYVSHHSPYYLWADDVNHVQMSYLLTKGDLTYTVNNWTRPLYSIPCATLISLFGYSLQSCRLLEIFSTIGTAILLFLITYYYTKSRTLSTIAVLLFAIIPMNTLLATSNFSGPLFTFVLMLGFYFLIQEKLIASSITISLLPLLRSEGFVIILMWALYYLYTHYHVHEKKIYGIKIKTKGIHLKKTPQTPYLIILLLLLAIPMLLWGIASYFIIGNFLNPIQTYPFWTSEQYITPLLTYLARIIYGIGIFTSLLFVSALIHRKKLPEKIKLSIYIILFFIIINAILGMWGIDNAEGVVEYISPAIPLMILCGILCINKLSYKHKTIIILSILLITAQTIELYAWKADWKNNNPQKNTDKLPYILKESAIKDNNAKTDYTLRWPYVLNRPSGHNRDIIRGKWSPIWELEVPYQNVTEFYFKNIPKEDQIQLCGVTMLTSYKDNRYPYRLIHTIQDRETCELCPNCIITCDFTNRTWIIKHNGNPLKYPEIMNYYDIVYENDIAKVLKKKNESFRTPPNNLTIKNITCSMHGYWM